MILSWCIQDLVNFTVWSCLFFFLITSIWLSLSCLFVCLILSFCLSDLVYFSVWSCLSVCLILSFCLSDLVYFSVWSCLFFCLISSFSRSDLVYFSVWSRLRLLWSCLFVYRYLVYLSVWSCLFVYLILSICLSDLVYFSVWSCLLNDLGKCSYWIRNILRTYLIFWCRLRTSKAQRRNEIRRDQPNPDASYSKTKISEIHNHE